jgi:hypothetical protein
MVMLNLTDDRPCHLLFWRLQLYKAVFDVLVLGLAFVFLIAGALSWS